MDVDETLSAFLHRPKKSDFYFTRDHIELPSGRNTTSSIGSVVLVTFSVEWRSRISLLYYVVETAAWGMDTLMMDAVTS